jgi:hypothetical protein
VPEPEKADEKERRPTDEKRDHEPVDHDNEVIHVAAVGGVVFREADEFGEGHVGRRMGNFEF